MDLLTLVVPAVLVLLAILLALVVLSSLVILLVLLGPKHPTPQVPLLDRGDRPDLEAQVIRVFPMDRQNRSLRLDPLPRPHRRHQVCRRRR